MGCADGSLGGLAGLAVGVAVLLVTVVAPGGRRADLAVPAEAPVADLLGALARPVLGAATADPWSLATADGVPLPPDCSLLTCGIRDGATLTLSPAPPATHPAGGHLVPAAPPATYAARGHLIPAPPLPRPVWGRATTALRALVGSGPVPAGMDPGSGGQVEPGPEPAGSHGPDPKARSSAGWDPGPVARAMRAWRATGYQHRLRAAVAEPTLVRCARVGVLSATPGAGGTTVAALLSAVLADGHDATVAVDAHPGPGSLSEVLASRLEVAADELLDVLEHPALTWPQLRAALGGPGSRLAVLAGPAEDDPDGPSRPAWRGGPGPAGRVGLLDAAGWARAVRGLARHATAVVVDCGPGLAAPAAQAAIATADQLVLVTDPRVPGGVRGAAGQLAGLRQPVAVVVNRAPAGLDAAQVLDQAPWARGAFLLPDDPAGTASLGTGPFAWERAPSRLWRQAYELAVLLVSDWPALGVAAEPGTAPAGRGLR